MVKVKLTICMPWRHMESRGVPFSFLTSAVMGMSGHVMPWLLYARGESSWYPLNGKCGVPLIWFWMLCWREEYLAHTRNHNSLVFQLAGSLLHWVCFLCSGFLTFFIWSVHKQWLFKLEKVIKGCCIIFSRNHGVKESSVNMKEIWSV